MIEISSGTAEVRLQSDRITRMYSSVPSYNLSDLLLAVERTVGAVHPDGSGEAVIAHLKEARNELTK